MIKMTVKQVTIEVSEECYNDMVWAKDECSLPEVADFARQAVQEKIGEMKHQVYRRELEKLRQEVRAAGGAKSMGLGETKEEIIENLRKLRQQIFEEEYAHLYR